MECFKINPALSLLMKHLVIGQRQTAPNFLAFHCHHTVVWFPLVSILLTSRVVHLLKRIETSLLITEADLITFSHSLQIQILVNFSE